MLYCNDNKLTKLDVSKNPKMYCLECADNRLTSLKLGRQKNLNIAIAAALQIGDLPPQGALKAPQRHFRMPVIIGDSLAFSSCKCLDTCQCYLLVKSSGFA